MLRAELSLAPQFLASRCRTVVITRWRCGVTTGRLGVTFDVGRAHIVTGVAYHAADRYMDVRI